MVAVCQRSVANDLNNQQALGREAREPGLIPGLVAT